MIVPEKRFVVKAEFALVCACRAREFLLADESGTFAALQRCRQRTNITCAKCGLPKEIWVRSVELRL